MDNPEKLATRRTQDTGRRQTKCHVHYLMYNIYASHIWVDIESVSPIWVYVESVSRNWVNVESVSRIWVNVLM